MIEMKSKKRIIHRVSKLRCLSCGSRDKKLVFLSLPTDSNDIVGFATTCCNCGHIHKFMFKDREHRYEERNIEAMITGKFVINEFRCGTDHAFCPNKGCKYYNTCEHPSNPLPYPDSVYRPGYEEIKTNTHHDKHNHVRRKHTMKTYL